MTSPITPRRTAHYLCRGICSIALISCLLPQEAGADLVAHWDFNQTTPFGVTVDGRAGLAPRVLGGAVVTADAGGRSGSAGDRAMTLGTAQQRVHLPDAGYFTAAAAGDVMSVSYWIRHNTVRGATPLAFVAPSTLGARGFQAHTPWSNSIMYFDTGGCCDGTMRISVNPGATWTLWHQIVLVKNLSAKTMYLDGVQVQTGTNTAPIAVAFTELFLGNASNLGEAVDGDIDEFAVYSHALTATDAAALAGGAAPDSLPGVTLTDVDLDALPDMWETRFFPNTGILTGPAADHDGDGLSNANEFNRGTNPNVPDTDGDGVLDGVETGTGTWVSATDTGTSPLATDSDGDALPDGVETNTGVFVSNTNTGTNPNTKDYDGDLVEDGHEVGYGSSPVNASSTPLTPGVPTLLAWWQFNDNSSPLTARDTRAGHTGVFSGASGYSPDAEGVTALPGDRAMRTTAAGGRMFLANASWANIGTRVDKLTISFWEKVPVAAASSALWFYSPAAGAASAFRGYQAHLPYAGNAIYFDHAGCCTGNQRLSGTFNTVDWAQWHHYVLLKDGVNKAVYIDGVQVLSQSTAAPLTTDFTALTVGCDLGNSSVIGWIDDFAIFASGLTQQQITDLATRAKTPLEISTSPDADGDGLPDAWEFIHFPADLTKLGAPPADYDNDLSTDANELVRLTNPNDSDSDDDGLFDGVETGTGVWVSPTNRGTNPLLADTDGDGLQDSVESNTGTFVSETNTGTNPFVADTDNDTFRDGAEVAYHSNPNSAASVPFTAGQTFLLALWPFDDSGNPVAANDVIAGIPGASTGSYTPDTGGHSGAAGDRALSITPNQGVTANAAFMSLAAPGDSITIAFWQKLNTVRNSSAFWAGSSNAANANRGIQAHVPWGDFSMYFDHAGCCNDGVERMAGPLPPIDTTQWHQFTLLKSGLTKQIFVDGVLAVDGQGSDPIPNDFTTLTIGGGDAGYTDGFMDDFAVFAGALTGEQITRLARGETPSTVLQPLPRGFEITNAHFNAGGTYHLEWSSIPNYRYTVQVSTTMDAGSWVPLTGYIPSGGAVTMTDVTLPAGPRLFIRVVQ